MNDDGVRLPDFPDMGEVDADTRFIVARGRSSGHHKLPALERYLSGGRIGVPVKGAKGDGVADDWSPIHDAIQQAAEQGADVLLDAKPYRIGKTLAIGDGSSAAVSRYGGVRLIGAGQPPMPPNFMAGYPVAANRGTRLVWGGEQGGAMLSVRGPLHGWGLHNLFLDGAGGEDFGGRAGRGVEVISGMGGDVRNLTVRGAREAPVYSTTVAAPPGVLVADSLHNSWQNLNLACGWADGVKGIVLTGVTPAGPNTCYNDFQNVAITLPTDRAVAPSAFGVYFQSCDSNVFRNLHLFNGHNQCIGVVFDYTVNPDWPAGNQIYGADWGGLVGPVQNAGTPSAAAKPNFVYGVAETNNGFMPQGVANLFAETGVVFSEYRTGLAAVHRRQNAVATTTRAGLYRVSYNLLVTGGGANGGKLSVVFSWLDNVGTPSHASSEAANGPGNHATGSFTARIGSFGSLSYETLLPGIGGSVTTQYALMVAVERLF